jgi:hypothetical protein
VVNEGPAGLIPQSLVVEDEILDLIGKLCTLPLALPATSLLALTFGSSSGNGPDRVSRCTEFVSRDMSHRHGRTGGVSRFPRGAHYLSGRDVCGKGSGARRSHSDLTPRPGVRLFDLLARTAVRGLRLLEEVEYVLRAISCPRPKTPMVGIQ